MKVVLINLMLKKTFLVSTICLSFLFLFANVIGAQTTGITDTGLSVTVNDTNVQNGDLICATKDGYKLCKVEYDPSVYGIVDSNAQTSITISSLQNSQILIFKGETNIRVSSINGNIKKGDLLTTSTIPGVAELAKKEGYVIGTAQADYSSNDKNSVGNINVSVNIHANTKTTVGTRQNLVELLRNGLSGLGVDPISALRYILAAAVVIASLVTGFIYFGRIAKTGVEAIGRNPLAGGRIEASVVINISIMLIIVGGGLGIAYLILAI